MSVRAVRQYYELLAVFGEKEVANNEQFLLENSPCCMERVNRVTESPAQNALSEKIS